MTPQTFIFIGRSGSGKGTQAKLLETYIGKQDSEKRAFLHIETGARFREFIEQDTYSSNLAKEVMKSGERQPDFLAVWMWSHLFVENLNNSNDHWIIDGTPRSLSEAQVLDTTFSFYKREKPIVIYINVSREWSEKHLLSRGRTDDTREDIEKRLNWFDRDVVPAIEYYKNDSKIRLIEVQGEQSIENVHQQIIEGLKL